MKLKQLAAILATAALVGCTKSTPVASPGPEIEQRLQAIESQLARIESAIQAGHSPALSANTKEQIKIYISGEVKNPGQFMVDKDITLLGALAVAGGPTESAYLKKIVIKKKEQDEPVIALATSSAPLSEGDVITVPEKIF